MERWVKIPPPDFLKYIRLWICLRGIPVSHRTVVAITLIEEKFGQVTEVAFDPNKAQTQNFVRVGSNLMSLSL